MGEWLENCTKYTFCNFLMIPEEVDVIRQKYVTRHVNPSLSKPLGTHIFYQGGGGGRVEPTSPHEPEILQGIRETFESLRNVKVVYIVFTWLA